MDQIFVEDIKLYAYHGCLEEEAKIGSDYLVNVRVWGDLSIPAVSDDLSDTIDYVLINKIVSDEMAIRAKLLEHVAQRILTQLQNIKGVQKSEVSVAKCNPPINGDVKTVRVILQRESK